jgi:membrane protease YdiL (CAAX protease family)
LPEEPHIAFLFALLVAALHFWSSIAYLRRAKTHTTARSRRPLRRPARGFGRSVLVAQIAYACLLWFLYDDMESWNAASVGLESKWGWPTAMLVGIFCYAIFFVSLIVGLRLSGSYGRIADENTRILVSLWPRNRFQKCMAAIAIWLINPVTEELLFRGIMVYQLALVGGSTAFAIGVGFLIHVANHTYQGLLPLTTHVPFYAIVVGLLFSPTGLWGAIGFHLAGDIIPFLLIRTAVRQYHRRHTHSHRICFGRISRLP